MTAPGPSLPRSAHDSGSRFHVLLTHIQHKKLLSNFLSHLNNSRLSPAFLTVSSLVFVYIGVPTKLNFRVPFFQTPCLERALCHTNKKRESAWLKYSVFSYWNNFNLRLLIEWKALTNIGGEIEKHSNNLKYQDRMLGAWLYFHTVNTMQSSKISLPPNQIRLVPTLSGPSLYKPRPSPFFYTTCISSTKTTIRSPC